MAFFSSYIGSLLILLLACLMVMGWLLLRRTHSISGMAGKTPMDYKQEAFKVIPYPLVIINANNIFLYVNPAAENMFKMRLRRLMGRDYKSIFSLIDNNTDLPISNFSRLAESSRWKECELKVGDKKILTAELSVILLDSAYQSEYSDSYVLSFKDITQRKALESQVEILEKRDSLTHLYNRKAFESLLKAVIHDSRKHGASHVFFHLSIDQFKKINETIGYTAGDVLIRRVAELLQQNVDKSIDFLSRLNMDEFGILFRERGISSAANTMRHIHKAAKEFQFTWNRVTYPITISGGFVLVTNTSTTAAKLLSDGDLTCRIARDKGGDRILAYNKNNQDVQRAENDTKGMWNLKDAFRDNRFRLFAQPIHALEPAKYKLPYSHYEILIRMYDEDGNIIPPDEFIPVAENNGMMPELDRWVVRDVMRQLKSVTQQSPPPVFAINLSGISLDDEDFLDFVLKEIDATQIDPRMLCFEITEQVAVSNIQLAEKFIETLRARGSSFSLDDFGTGVSSYGYLRSLNVDYLKIDGIFIKDILSDDVSRAMVQSIVQVGHTMGLKIIAEYVENDQIINLLRIMSVDYGQGYGINRPEPLQELIQAHT
ncbi:MAG: EAL domain-containing protein [Cocleimonas sp.]|nr:EAL domain-containing protein [Cocleimonas sp.]